MKSPRATLRPFTVLAALLASGVVAAPLPGADFAPIDEAARRLERVEGAPNASAVVLFEHAELWMMDPARGRVSSRLHVEARVKILTEEGRESYGEIEIPHSRHVRLSAFEGRTVLPDGRVVPLPDDAVFERRSSASRKIFVTAAAFPAVQVGAILDYRYDLHFDSIFYLEPWYFQSRVPTLRSKIDYYVPDDLSLRIWAQNRFKSRKIQQDSRREAGGRRITFWMERLPGVPSEPFAWPFADLSAKVMLIPSAVHSGGLDYPLLDSWKSVCKLIDEQYRTALRRHHDVRAKAREIVTKAGKDPVEQARALYTFVRDRIETVPLPGVLLAEGSNVDAVLAGGRGDYAEKALLLASLLEAVKIDAELVWVAERQDGRVDLGLANPAWFDSIVVRAHPGGREVFLDPSDPTLGFGFLRPGNEGMAAVVFDHKSPQTIDLPTTSFEKNLRKAVVDLAVDEEGRATGHGELDLSGQHAWLRLGWRNTPEETAEAWTDWLEEAYPGFAIDGVEVDESIPERHVRVSWTMAQLQEEVLGDEESLLPSRPLGPFQQRFQLAASERRTPVLFSFADRDEVELHLSWPDGWEVESAPPTVSEQGTAGSLSVSVERQDGEHRLTYHRRLDLPKREIVGRDGYGAVRALDARAEENDAEPVLLVRR